MGGDDTGARDHLEANAPLVGTISNPEADSLETEIARMEKKEDASPSLLDPGFLRLTTQVDPKRFTEALSTSSFLRSERPLCLSRHGWRSMHHNRPGRHLPETVIWTIDSPQDPDGTSAALAARTAPGSAPRRA
jgi:hypothetical protein